MRKSGHAAPALGDEPVTVAEVAAEIVQPVVTAAAEEPHAKGLAGAVLFTLKLLAAPFAGLAFVIALPFVALGALAWAGLKAATVRTA
jgi:hypothetical protein